METMRNVHRLRPCAYCGDRMAVPGTALCTICDAVCVPAAVPDDVSYLMPRCR